MDRSIEAEEVSGQCSHVDDATRDYLREIYASHTADASQRLQFSVAFAQSGLHALTLINGGALVALFAFVGAAGSLTLNMSDMWLAFVSFSVGLACNIVAYLGGHLSQDHFYIVSQHVAWNVLDQIAGKDPTYEYLSHHKMGTRFQAAAIAFAVIALIAFIAGAAFALKGVSTT